MSPHIFIEISFHLNIVCKNIVCDVAPNIIRFPIRVFHSVCVSIRNFRVTVNSRICILPGKKSLLICYLRQYNLIFTFFKNSLSTFKL